jgi:hypothetical protein
MIVDLTTFEDESPSVPLSSPQPAVLASTSSSSSNSNRNSSSNSSSSSSSSSKTAGSVLDLCRAIAPPRLVPPVSRPPQQPVDKPTPQTSPAEISAAARAARQAEEAVAAIAATAAAAAVVSNPAKRPLHVAASSKRLVQPKKVAKKDMPHVLLWICAHGKGQGRNWKQQSLRVIGIYADKAAAENKKMQICDEHVCCGHGDICDGDTWEDEIDLVVRPVEEVCL